MDNAQITWLTDRGFSVSQLTMNGRYMITRKDAAIYEDSGAGWLVTTYPADVPEGYTLRHSTLRGVFQSYSRLRAAA